ncbi:Rrf2 family protein (putative transcriptional regulator) [Elusimicrobium minutum Pei191]|uniref:Rrf2 family protein (Putative transcriptional regulator) n=1 Tax=Elusimicrobium minutum (strain Pei191) TaxID=445932 RepID=B2KDL3_ELUMP|nr:Rrf2 family transcriptional regulator [Elusimicrobium minutum]ACC98609.1 Rrf2 family protein (putative transcriptional regulator) [Elusimicrobium minutum Pei191]
MKTNTRFTTAVHILALLALNKKEANTSALLAKSVNTNPVVVRRILSMLKKANIVDSKPGVKGVTLKRGPLTISLLEIYDAVKSPSDTFFPLHKNPSKECFIGANIHSALYDPLKEASQAAEKILSKYSLKDITRPITKKELLRVSRFVFN